MNLPASGQGAMPICCEHDNKISGCLGGRNLLTNRAIGKSSRSTLLNVFSLRCRTKNKHTGMFQSK
jgi:hypothetical protein